MQQKNAKCAQSQSDELYFALYLQLHESIETDAVVIGIGEKSFTVLVPLYGVEYRLFMDEVIQCSTNSAIISYDYNKRDKVITLQIQRPLNTQDILQIKIIKVHLMSRLKVKLFASKENLLLKSRVSLLL